MIFWIIGSSRSPLKNVSGETFSHETFAATLAIALRRSKKVSLETFSHETLDPWFVTGFCDGEASFTYSRSGRQIAMYFAIKLSASDRAVVERIHQYFGVGRLYDVKARSPRNERSGYTKSAVMYRVTRKDELGVITNHFDRFPLQSEKRAVYRLWKDMVELRRDYGGSRELLDDLAVELSAAVPRNQSWR